MRCLSALLAALLIAASVHAQSNQTGGLVIDRFGLEDGLPGLFIRNLAVSGDGMMWLSASGMLVSFDGLEFEQHDLTTFSASEGILRGLGPGRGDTLWVVIGRQVFSYSAGRSSLRAEPPTRVHTVWQTDDGTLRLWDDSGMVRLTESDYERELTFSATTDSAEAALPELWPLAPGDVRVVLPGRSGRRTVHSRRVAEPRPFPEAWSVPGPSEDVVVAQAGESGTVVTRLDGSPVTTIPPEAGFGPLLLDRRGWVWTRRPGQIVAVGPSGDIVATMDLATGAEVTLAAEDPEGSIWVGTLRDGLYRIRPRAVSVIGESEGLTDGQVLRVFPGDDGSVIAIEQFGRVVRIGDAGVTTVFDPPAGTIADVAMVDRRGTTWYTSRQRLETVLHGRTVDGAEIDIPLTGIVGQLVADPTDDGILWAVFQGLYRIRPYAPGGPVVEGPLVDSDRSDMLVDPDGVVWMIGGRRLTRYSDTGVLTYTFEDGFPLDRARALHRSEDGTIWIGRYSGGIVRFRDGEFGVVRAADGLWDDVVSSILEDDAGNLWMGSNRGVHRVSRRELDAFLDGETGRVRGRGYGQDAGFQNAENSGNPGYRTPDGRLWFPTFSGIAVIDPAEVLVSEQASPRIRIRGVNAGGDRVAPDSTIVLPRGARRVDVAYGATLLSGQAGIRYEVRLDGVDTDWTDAGSQRQVTYGNLPPGTHTFRARAISGAGVASVEEATISMVVPPFFYETAGFRLVLFLTALSALWFAYHLRVRQLRAREAELERVVDERTHDLARAMSTVETQANELRSLDEAKSRFFANVSHELRTPLTLVQGPLQDVLDGRLGPTPEPVREQVATVLASGKRLGQLVEQLLDVARLESGEFRLHLRQQDLQPLFDQLVHSFAALARSRGVTFQATLPEGPIPARVDADQIQKVYANLLANAVKFTPAGGHVALTVETTTAAGHSELVATVEDDGPGIPIAEQHQIFERFHQVDDASKRVHEGTGLGLALVKEITELHGGSVTLRSEPGKGSRFTVSVPVAGPTADVGPVSSAAVSSPEIVAASSPGIRSAGDIASEGPMPTAESERVAGAPTDATSDDTAQLTVLVVEDHDELRAYLRRHLEERYRVIEAANGRQGLEAARTAVPDLIVCDIMMPEMDGEEMCRAIRSEPELSYLPIIMLTAKASRQSRLSALEGGADDYLVKPFDSEELRLRVGNALDSRRRFAERLRAQGSEVPFVPLELPQAASSRDFATDLDGLLRQRMGDEDFGIDAMADALAMSRATLFRKADEAFGVSPMEILWTFRLDHAAHWLRETDGTVSEVAYGTGFKTVPHFTRRFRERFGKTPAAYRTQG